jgi:hypothetical protein
LEFELDKNYFTCAHIPEKDYKLLVKYLELEFNPDHTFRPSDIFAVLNSKIPISFSVKPKYQDVIRAASMSRTIEECNKTNNCGRYANPEGKNVRPGNYEKTLAACGEEIANTTRQRRISSKWTDKSSEENLSEINKYTQNCQTK